MQPHDFSPNVYSLMARQVSDEIEEVNTDLDHYPTTCLLRILQPMIGSAFHSHGEPHVLKTADDRQAFPQTPEDRREPQSLRCHQRNSGGLRRLDHCSGLLGGHRQGFTNETYPDAHSLL